MKLRINIFVIILVICVFPGRSWDIAVSLGDHLEFLNGNGTVVGNITENITEVRALAYNSELKKLYLADYNSIVELEMTQPIPNMSQGGREVPTKAVVARQQSVVKGLAYDAMTGILYWTTGREGKSIMWVRVFKGGSNGSGEVEHSQAGLPLLSLGQQIPVGIAIDTCKRYLYWTNCQIYKETIERSLLDGSGREVLISEDLNQMYAIVVDQRTDRLYWIDDRYDNRFRIETCDLNGKDRRKLVDDKSHQPFSLAVSGNVIFWADHIHNSIWSLPLRSPYELEHKNEKLVAKYPSSPHALVSVDTGRWVSDKCNPVKEPQTKVIPATVTRVNVTAGNTTRGSSISRCSNYGIYDAEKGYCDCVPGYSGALCEIDECSGHCLYGTCHLVNSKPTCVCEEGFSGERCETSICHNYCVTGTCSVDITGQPQCHCKDGYSGQRCEINFTQQQELKDELHKVCQTFCRMWAHSSDPRDVQPYDSSCNCTALKLVAPPDSYHSFDYQMLSVLAVCSLMMTIIAILTRKVCVLNKRPRIKKRIIVNKSVTPLTCRPNQTSDGEQCEITIENCCNMNICETVSRDTKK